MKKNTNIMNTLTPKPPFNPAKKNNAVSFGKPHATPGAIKSKRTMSSGVDRTTHSLN